MPPKQQQRQRTDPRRSRREKADRNADRAQVQADGQEQFQRQVQRRPFGAMDEGAAGERRPRQSGGGTDRRRMDRGDVEKEERRTSIN